jgi:hypothetical protein
MNINVKPNGEVYNIFILGLSNFYFYFILNYTKVPITIFIFLKSFGGFHNQLILVAIYYHVKLPQQSLLSFYITIHN